MNADVVTTETGEGAAIQFNEGDAWTEEARVHGQGHLQLMITEESAKEVPPSKIALKK